jgi:hypothetical protein
MNQAEPPHITRRTMTETETKNNCRTARARSYGKGKERTGPRREDGGDGGADGEDDAVVLEHLMAAIGRATRFQRIDQKNRK